MRVTGSQSKLNRPGRNDACPCGSGKKYKQCCMRLSPASAAAGKLLIPTFLQAAVAHHRSGRLHEAAAHYRQVLQLESNHSDALNYLGVIAIQEGNYENAVEQIGKAISANPSCEIYYCNLGNALKGQGRLGEAVDSYHKALSLKPDYVEAHNNLGNALQDQGKQDEGIASYRKALACKPDFAEAHNNLGNALLEQGKPQEAVASFRDALSFRPDFAAAHNNLGHALQDQGKLEEAVVSFCQALSIRPDFAAAQNNLGQALQDQGKLEEAVAGFRKALSIKPDYAAAHSNLLFLHGYCSFLDPKEYLSLARKWEQAYFPAQDRQAAKNRNFRRLPLAGRRLKVGYVSGDYSGHAVSYFIEQLFRHHDRLRIELFAYSARGADTPQLQTLVEHWVPVRGMSDSAIRERVDADGIDVLIDLSGHTANNRLGVFARRAAPVQAHYLGFFASTGLTEMDYWIGDEILTPHSTDSHFSEQVWRLPRVWVCYDGNAGAPLPEWQPAADGSVWIGSFNHLNKLTPETLALWARVLHALPEGRLLLKTKQLADAGNRQRILDTMAAHGIASNRIELQDGSITPDWPAHMSYYNRLDIALDPVGGVGGGTTTCDALWMAVPVVTLSGDRMASRMTASMLNALGHPEWIARSEAEYIDKVVTLARDVNLRKNLRETQRAQMACSPLCDARDLAMKLENAYVDMFERWLGGKNEPISPA